MARKTKETENNQKESLVKEVAKKIKETVTKSKVANLKEENKASLKKDEKKTSKKSRINIKNSEKAEKVAITEATRKTKTTKASSSSKVKNTKKEPTVSQKKVAEDNSVPNKVIPQVRKVKYDNLIKKNYSPEYYDLPFRYNQTVVKILAQTPTKLFIYWDISDIDRENLKKNFGEYFFQITKPVLIVHNKTMNYSFEVDIDDFANSWYLPIQDSNCDYQIELGRRPIPVNYSYMPEYNVAEKGEIEPVHESYIYISSSNELESPNDRVLFNNTNKIYFRDVKTNKIIEKDIKDFPFINKNNEFISIYKIYQDLFKDVLSGENFEYLDLTNPSSGGNPGSGSLSSR